MDFNALLESIPPLAVYLVVGGIIGLESLGIPLPGEIVLVTAALLSTRANLDLNPIGVGVAATIGAVIGDSIGYSIGHRFGMSLFERLGRRFPKHFGPGHVALARRLFSRWGVWAVFFGRFVALLRIFAGPLAGALKMRYSHFLAANASGAIVWAGGTTAAIYYVGLAAESFLKDFSWIALIVGALIALTVTLVLKDRTAKAIKDLEAEHDWDSLRNN